MSTRFQKIPRPRSVAEARLSASEIDLLRSWFQATFAEEWWSRDWLANKGDQFTDQAQAGALLLVFAAEIARRNGDEEAVWPAVAREFQANEKNKKQLFDWQGQPTSSCKRALAAGARALEVRNLIDRAGAQEYFDTIKLQYGFSLAGAEKRLADWLRDQGKPLAVKILLGDAVEFAGLGLESVSFQKLWRALKTYRNGGSREEAWSAVSESAWVPEEWRERLLVAATAPRLAMASQAQAQEDSDEDLCKVLLRSPEEGLVLAFDRAALEKKLVDCTRAKVLVDGKPVDHIMSSGGQWRIGEVPCQPRSSREINWRPKRAAVVANGGVAIEVDLSDRGLSEPLVGFDLATRERVDLDHRFTAGKELLLICSPDLSIEGEDRRTKSASFFQIALTERTRVLSDGALFWEPNLASRAVKAPKERPEISLDGGRDVAPDSRQQLTVSLMNPAQAVEVRIEGSRYPAEWTGSVWRTKQPVLIYDLLTKEHLCRVRIDGRAYAPKLKFTVRGVGIAGEKDADAWCRIESKTLQIRDGVGRGRIFAPGSIGQLFEGSRLVQKSVSRNVEFRDLRGWGAPLAIQEVSRRIPLVNSVEDRGCIRIFKRALLGTVDTSLILTEPRKEVSTHHEVLIWDQLELPPRRLPHNAIEVLDDGFTWRLPRIGEVAALAVAFRGERRGAYWTRDRRLIADSLQSASEEVFRRTRWLKMAILHSDFRVEAQAGVRRNAQGFIRAWSEDKGVDGLVFSDRDEGAETVAREMLWDYCPKRNEKPEDLLSCVHVTAREEEREEDQVVRRIDRLSQLCPTLAWRVVEMVKPGSARAFSPDRVVFWLGAAHAWLRSWDLHIPEHLDTLGRECAKMIGVESPQLDGWIADQLDDQPQLRELAERERGRRFITATLLNKTIQEAQRG